MAVIITGNNTPTAGGVTYGDGSTYANTAAGAAGGVLYSAGASAPAFSAAGTSGQLLQSNGAGAPTWTTPSSGGFTLGTPVASTSGTSIDFTGIPATAKVIIINMISISTNGTTGLIIQIGDSGGIETTNYISCTTSGNSRTDGFLLQAAMVAVNTYVSQVQLVLENSTTNTWTSSGATIDVTNGALQNSAGTKSLSAVLDRVRVTTFAPAATFDAGEINIAYI
jgi:hypothetical protein